MDSVLSTMQDCIQAESFHTLPKVKDTHWCFPKECIANFKKHINCDIRNTLSHYMSQKTLLKTKYVSLLLLSLNLLLYLYYFIAEWQ